MSNLVFTSNAVTIGSATAKYCTIGENYQSLTEGNIENLNIPDYVTSIAISVFNGCSSLESVTIGSNVKAIGNHAFSTCSSLTSATFKVTEGWYYGMLSIPNMFFDSTELADPSKAAEYLVAYSILDWNRN